MPCRIQVEPQLASGMHILLHGDGEDSCERTSVYSAWPWKYDASARVECSRESCAVPVIPGIRPTTRTTMQRGTPARITSGLSNFQWGFVWGLTAKSRRHFGDVFANMLTVGTYYATSMHMCVTHQSQISSFSTRHGFFKAQLSNSTQCRTGTMICIVIFNKDPFPYKYISGINVKTILKYN